MADEFQAADGATRALLALAECRRSGLLTDREVTACKLGVARDDALLRAAVNCYAISRDLGEFSHSCRSMLLLHAAEPMATPVADAGGPDRVLLYRADAFAAIAAQAAAMSRGGVELGDIAWGSFADGFPNLVIANARDLRHRRVAFIASLHSTEVLFQQIAIAYALPRYMASHVHIIIPYFPTGERARARGGGAACNHHDARASTARASHHGARRPRRPGGDRSHAGADAERNAAARHRPDPVHHLGHSRRPGPWCRGPPLPPAD